GQRIQNYHLLAQLFYLAAMVLLAASVSLRPFRFGGVQQMVLGGVVVGFLLYVMSKVVGDLSKAGLMPPAVAAALPPLAGGLTGLVMLLYQEDGGWRRRPPLVQPCRIAAGGASPRRLLPSSRSCPARGHRMPSRRGTRSSTSRRARRRRPSRVRVCCRAA